MDDDRLPPDENMPGQRAGLRFIAEEPHPLDFPGGLAVRCLVKTPSKIEGLVARDGSDQGRLIVAWASGNSEGHPCTADEARRLAEQLRDPVALRELAGVVPLTLEQLAGWRLADARAYAGLSLGQAAKLLALPRAELEAWEAGEGRPDELTCRRMGALYQVRIWEIVEPGYITPRPELTGVVCMLTRGRKPTERDRATLARWAQFHAESVKVPRG